MEPAITEDNAESLRETFFGCLRRYFALSGDLESWVPDESEELKASGVAAYDALLKNLHRVAFSVEKAGVFSTNEEVDDINTVDLLFVLVPFILGQVYASHPDLNGRRKRLESAVIYWKSFVSHTLQLSLCGTKESEATDQTFELDPAALRAEKVERFKRDAELKHKISYYLLKKKQSGADLYSFGVFDEDLERELVLALIKRSIITSLNQIDLAKKEIPLLERMEAIRSGEVSPPTPIAAKGKPWMLKIKDTAALRRMYHEKVFQPSHELPTISLAEVGDWEMALSAQLGPSKELLEKRRIEDERRKLRNALSGRDEKAADSDRSDSEGEEAKEEKARAWDDWKDEHPKGIGNKNRNVG